MRRPPPVTSATFGIGGAGSAPVSSPAGSSSAAEGTSFLARSYLGACHLARRNAGAPRDRAAARAVRAPRPGSGCACRSYRQPEIGLFEPADLVPQSRRLLEFEIGRGIAHALLKIGDHGFQIRALIMGRLALRQAKGHMIALINTFENVGDAPAHALGRDPVCGVVGLLLFAPPVGFLDRRLEAVGHAVGIKNRPAVDMPRRPPDRLDQRSARAQIALLVGI